VNTYLYIAAWALLWAGGGPTLKVLNQRLDARHLPPFLLKPRGQLFVAYTGLALSACVIQLLVWGLIHLKWYMVFVWLVVGIIASIPIELLFGSVLMIYAAWIPTLFLTSYLWFICALQHH
jgi:hypothetical protein